MLAGDLYGITVGYALASLGFGMTRPAFTAGASLAVPLAEQGAVAGVITAANGISFIAAPALGMALYAVDPNLPFALSALLLLVLAVRSRSLGRR
jgi:MFS family permease